MILQRLEHGDWLLIDNNDDTTTTVYYWSSTSDGGGCFTGTADRPCPMKTTVGSTTMALDGLSIEKVDGNRRRRRLTIRDRSTGMVRVVWSVELQECASDDPVVQRLFEYTQQLQRTNDDMIVQQASQNNWQATAQRLSDLFFLHGKRLYCYEILSPCTKSHTTIGAIK
jgi:hypothetical protein